jgi:acyl phosphate:glycerol-3-phosphate acyltransferase
LNTVYIVIALVAGYLIGSFPSAYLVARLRKGVDIRKVGSRNSGAMNVFYKVGFIEGLLVLGLDISKGAAAVAIADHLGVGLVVTLLAGVAAVLGHMFPIFLKFHGGKGGAACIGILVYFMPWGVPIYLALFLLLMWITRYPTLGYSLAFICFPFLAWFMYHHWEWMVYSLCLPILPLLKYIPRIIEMRRQGGSWKHVFYRKNLKDRL